MCDPAGAQPCASVLFRYAPPFSPKLYIEAGRRRWACGHIRSSGLHSPQPARRCCLPPSPAAVASARRQFPSSSRRHSATFSPRKMFRASCRPQPPLSTCRWLSPSATAADRSSRSIRTPARIPRPWSAVTSACSLPPMRSPPRSRARPHSSPMMRRLSAAELCASSAASTFLRAS